MPNDWPRAAAEEICDEVYETSGPGTGISSDEMVAIIVKHAPSGCINCHSAFGSTSYGFGPSTPPGAERREVGPLCEKCYNLIYVHIGVKRHT